MRFSASQACALLSENDFQYTACSSQGSKMEFLSDSRIGFIVNGDANSRITTRKLGKLCKNIIRLDNCFIERPRNVDYLSIPEEKFTEEHKNYELESRIGYDKILAVDILDDFIECPTYASGANIAVKMTDDTMEPRIRKGEYAIVEFNSPLNSRDIGLFFYNNKFYIRKFIARKDSIALRSENRLDIPDITIDLKDKFYIIGKVVGVYNEKK